MVCVLCERAHKSPSTQLTLDDELRIGRKGGSVDYCSADRLVLDIVEAPYVECGVGLGTLGDDLNDLTDSSSSFD